MNFSAVLVLTDLTTIQRLESPEPSWKPMAIRYEEAQDIDTLAFFCRETLSVTHVAVLDSEEPWVPVYMPGKPVTFLPNICEVIEAIEGPEMDRHQLSFIEGMDKLPEHNIEGVIIEDMDAVLNDEDLLPSLILDEFILNRRNVNTRGALRYLQEEGLDLMAVAEEFTEVSAGLAQPELEELPTNWAKGWTGQTDEDRRSLLALLNSAVAE